MKTYFSSTFGNNLADKSQQFQLETQYGHTIQLLVNQHTQQPIIALKNKRGQTISQAQLDIQLNAKRLQSVEIEQVAYDSETKKLIFIFADESTVQASIQALWDQLEQTVIGQLALLKKSLTGQHDELSELVTEHGQSLHTQAATNYESTTELIQQIASALATKIGSAASAESTSSGLYRQLAGIARQITAITDDTSATDALQRIEGKLPSLATTTNLGQTQDNLLKVIGDFSSIEQKTLVALLTAILAQVKEKTTQNLSNELSDKPGLLGGCTALRSAKGMFSHCTSFSKLPPADLFTAIDIPAQQHIALSLLSDISQLFKNCYRMGVRISNSLQPITVANTTHWDNDQLERSGRVVLLYGHSSHVYPISYQSIFDETDTRVQVNLIKLPSGNTDMYGGYLVPQDWLKCCPNLTTVAQLFCTCGFPIDTNGAPQWQILKSNSDKSFILPFLAIPADLFSYAQTNITTFEKAFAQNLLISGTQLTSKHFTAQIKLTTLKDVFKWSKVLDIQQNNSVVFGQGTYRSVNNVQRIFYGTNALYCTSTRLNAKNETVIGNSFFDSGELRGTAEGSYKGTYFTLGEEEYKRTLATNDLTANNLCFITKGPGENNYINKLFTNVPFENARFPLLNPTTRQNAYWPLLAENGGQNVDDFTAETIRHYAESFVQPRVQTDNTVYHNQELFFKAEPYAWVYSAALNS